MVGDAAGVVMGSGSGSVGDAASKVCSHHHLVGPFFFSSSAFHMVSEASVQTRFFSPQTETATLQGRSRYHSHGYNDCSHAASSHAA